MQTQRIATGCLLLALTILAITACAPQREEPASGGTTGQPTAPAAAETAAPQAGTKAPESVGTDLTIAPDKGALAGVVRFEGTPPKARNINFGPEIQCSKLHKTPPTVEALVVNPNGTLKWTLVSIKDRVPGDYKIPEKPVIIDQVGCVFVPHVAAVMEGQGVEFRNSDPVTHNVRANPRVGRPINLLFPPQGPPQIVELSPRELNIPIKCDIHFWMAGFIHVLRQPFFSVTGDEGTFTINDIPPGTYKLEARHETLKEQTQEVKVEAGKLTRIDFVFAK